MSLQRAWLPTAILICLIAAGANPGVSQTPRSHSRHRPHPPSANPRRATGSAHEASPESPATVGIAPAHKTYTVPAGTKVLLELRSAINTKSAKAGDGVYLPPLFPVVVGNRVMIPTGVYVQGIVDRVQRGGRIKGQAQLEMHFTSIIFPNGSVVEIPGVVDSMPGTKTRP